MTMTMTMTMTHGNYCTSKVHAKIVRPMLAENKKIGYKNRRQFCFVRPIQMLTDGFYERPCK
jgi:hypothetical protein